MSLSKDKMKIKTNIYKKICDDCGDLFPISNNDVRHKEKLCEKCWKKSKKNSTMGDKKFGKKGNEGHRWINTNSQYIGSYSKKARKVILFRNEMIEELREVNDRLSKENIKLKEEIKIYKN